MIFDLCTHIMEKTSPAPPRVQLLNGAAEAGDAASHSSHLSSGNTTILNLTQKLTIVSTLTQLPISTKVELQRDTWYNMHCSLLCTIGILRVQEVSVQCVVQLRVVQLRVVQPREKSVHSSRVLELTIGRISAGRTARRLAQI